MMVANVDQESSLTMNMIGRNFKFVQMNLLFLCNTKNSDAVSYVASITMQNKIHTKQFPVS